MKEAIVKIAWQIVRTKYEELISYTTFRFTKHSKVCLKISNKWKNWISSIFFSKYINDDIISYRIILLYQLRFCFHFGFTKSVLMRKKMFFAFLPAIWGRPSLFYPSNYHSNSHPCKHQRHIFQLQSVSSVRPTCFSLRVLSASAVSSLLKTMRIKEVKEVYYHVALITY